MPGHVFRPVNVVIPLRHRLDEIPEAILDLPATRVFGWLREIVRREYAHPFQECRGRRDRLAPGREDPARVFPWSPVGRAGHAGRPGRFTPKSLEILDRLVERRTKMPVPVGDVVVEHFASAKNSCY